jgi:hypothetical protein
MNPQTFSPIELEMKRVIGLGGQRVRWWFLIKMFIIPFVITGYLNWWFLKSYRLDQKTLTPKLQTFDRIVFGLKVTKKWKPAKIVLFLVVSIKI